MSEERSGKMSKVVAARLRGVDFGALDAYAEERRQQLRDRLEDVPGKMTEAETATLRGQIRELKELKRLEETVKRISSEPD